MIEVRKFYEYSELKWFLDAYEGQIEILEQKTLKTVYKLKYKWL